jgi:hypothetical protein
VSDHQADYPIATMCRLLGVSPSGYHAWVKRQPSRRAVTDAALTTEIHAAHMASRGTSGAPRIHAELASKGIHVGRKRVARLMRQAGVSGVSRRKFVTTTARGDLREASDLVERNFTADGPDRLWVADITYIDLVRLSVSRSGSRCLQPSHRRLVDGDDTRQPTGARRAGPGASDAAAAGRDPSLRPRLTGWIQAVVAT